MITHDLSQTINQYGLLPRSSEKEAFSKLIQASVKFSPLRLCKSLLVVSPQFTLASKDCPSTFFDTWLALTAEPAMASQIFLNLCFESDLFLTSLIPEYVIITAIFSFMSRISRNGVCFILNWRANAPQLISPWHLKHDNFHCPFVIRKVS